MMPTKEEFIKMRFFDRMPNEEIARRCGVNHTRPYKWMKKYDIPPFSYELRNWIKSIRKNIFYTTSDYKLKNYEKMLVLAYEDAYKEYLEYVESRRHHYTSELTDEQKKEILDMRYGHQMTEREITEQLGIHVGRFGGFSNMIGMPKWTHDEIIDLKTIKYWMYNTSTTKPKRQRYQKKYNDFWLNIAYRHGYDGIVHLIKVEE